MPVVNNQYSLLAGVQSDLKDMWKQKGPVYQKQQEKMIRFLPKNKIRNAFWAWKDALPKVRFWGYGSKRMYQTIRDRIMYLGKHNFEATLTYNRFDEEDDQLGDMQPHIQSVVNRYLQLYDRMAAEYVNGTADLNPSILTCYDGVSLFSATDGDGAARFGVTGGNILTGTGLTVSGVIHDVAMAQQRLMSFLDTAGAPIFSPEECDFKNLFVVGPKEANEVFQKAANSENIRTDSGSNTAESNYQKGTWEWDLNQYYTDTSDYYVYLKHAYYRAFAARAQEGVKVVPANDQNSDHARETGENALYTHDRCALGPWVPFVAIKINN